MERKIIAPSAKESVLREIYEERAAIMEFDGKIPRVDAERFAAQSVGFDYPPKEWATC